MRLRELSDAKGLTLKELAVVAGVPYRTLQNWVYGVRPPSVEALAHICTQLGVDANWLLLGTTRTGEIRKPGSITLDDEAQASGRLLVDEVQLGRASVAARRASHPLMWRVARRILEGGALGLTLEELIACEGEQNLSRADATAALSILQEAGLIEEEPNSEAARYVLSGRLAPLRFRDAHEVSAALVTVLEELTGRISPAVQEGRGKMVTASLRLPAGQGRAFARQLLDNVRSDIDSAHGSEGDDRVTLVLGVGVETSAMLGLANNKPRGSKDQS